MFSKPTTFILGAGISAPFKFPVGRQMKDAICNGTYRAVSGETLPTLPPDEMAVLLAECMGDGYAAGLATEFLDAFRAADLYSVDAWLEANQADHHIMRAGKAAIGVVIHYGEFLASERGADVDYDWFAWVWNNLWTPNIEDIEKNQVWFVTFNYDRLLEWKLIRQVRNTYLRASQEQHQKAILFLLGRIVHVHGVLGGKLEGNPLAGFSEGNLNALRVGSSEERKARRNTYFNRVRALARGINVVSETPEDESLVTRAKEFIRQDNARLVFLGFSFDKRNILKLGLDEYARTAEHFNSKDVERRLDGSQIIGTGMGIKRGERGTAETMLNGKLVLGGHDMDAVEFCRSYLKTA